MLKMILDLIISSEYRDSLHKYPDEQLEAMTMPVEIPWEPDILAKLDAHPGVKFVVFVPNIRAMATAAERLSQTLKFDITTLETGRLSLSGKGDKKWQDFVRSLGSIAARGLLLRLATRAIERGNYISSFALIVDDVLFEGVRPQDVDIMARAQNLCKKIL
jgi:hypothetical protein